MSESLDTVLEPGLDAALPGENNFLDMADDAFEETGFPLEAEAPAETEEESQDSNEESEELDTLDTLDEELEDEDAPDSEADRFDDSGDDLSASSGDSDPADSDTDGDTDTDSDSDDGEKPESVDGPDYKEFFEAVTAEFKANGRSMQINSPDDVVRLMQMGANYNRKMAAMKPHLKVMKTLDKHEISEADLGYLVDLKNKNPAAIANLLKDAQIDPLEFDADQGKDYKASELQVDEKELALDSVIDDLRGSQGFNQTLEVVGNQWDAASKHSIQDQPETLRVINDHIESGVYALASSELEKQRVLGQLNGLSDIEAYSRVADEMHANGKFDHLFKKPGQQATQSESPRQTDSQKAKKATERRKKRRAASPTKAASAPKQDQDFNPLGLSDDDYLKQFDEKFL